MKYRVIILDLDGTLLNTDEMIVAVFNELYQLYRGGILTPKEEIYYFSGPPLSETMKKEFIDQDPAFMVKEFSRLTPKYLAKTVTLYKDADETLKYFKKRGLKLAVVTNKLKKPTIEVLNLFDLTSLFDVVIALDDVKKGKPDPEGILKVLEKLNITDKKTAIYVGDNEVDYQVALKAGVDSAFVVWGPRILDNKLTPTVKIKSYKELKRYVEKS